MDSRKILLSQQIADEIKEMIVRNKEFKIGDRLPNEILLSERLNISRTTLREAIRILITQNILEVRRGKGTFVINDKCDNYELDSLNNKSSDLIDLFELRLMIEPMAAYYATKRASDKEIQKILEIGNIVKRKILNNEDRTADEHTFHYLVAKASHNSFIKELMPIINKGIDKGVILAKEFNKIDEVTINDYKMIMDFISDRNAEGAKAAMELHIINAMNIFGIKIN